MSDQNETPVTTPDAATPQPTETTNPPDHQQVGPGDADPTSASSNGTVYLPRLIADEYGMAEAHAREACMMGQIDIDGERYTGDRLNIPYDTIVGKEITVHGDIRSVRFTYNG